MSTSVELDPSEQLKQYRAFLGMTQAQFAGELGTTQTSVARWESRSSPISMMTMAHVRKIVLVRVMEETRRLFAKLTPSLALGDFEGLFSNPDADLRSDSLGNFYVGMVYIEGYRRHTLHMRLDNRQWYGLDREGSATKVDEHFLQSAMGARRF